MNVILKFILDIIKLMARRRWIRPRTGGSRQRYEFIPWTILIQTEIVIGTSTMWNFQASYNIVPATTQQGIRKVKNFTINLSDDTIAGGGTPPVNILWAIVLVPEDTNVNTLALISNAPVVYEPNQYVLAHGMLSSNQGPNRIFSPMKRNLRAGDSIALVLACYQQVYLAAVGGYSIGV